MKTLILVVIIFLALLIVANFGEYVTSAQSVSDLNPEFTYEQATEVAESI